MRYLISLALLTLLGCAGGVADDCVNPDGSHCSSAGKSNVRVWERK